MGSEQVTVVPGALAALDLQIVPPCSSTKRARDGKAKPAALMALGELVLDLLEGAPELA